MNATEIAQLIALLAPVLQSVVVEGTKIVATFRQDMTSDDMIKVLDASKSSSWPALYFGAK